LRGRSRSLRRNSIGGPPVYFVALQLGSKVRARLASVVDRMKDRHRVAATRGVTWADLRVAHLTLRFLGPLSDAAVDLLQRRLALVVTSFEPFGLQMAGGGAFRARGGRRSGNERGEHDDVPQTLFAKVGRGGVHLLERRNHDLNLLRCIWRNCGRQSMRPAPFWAMDGMRGQEHHTSHFAACGSLSASGPRTSTYLRKMWSAFMRTISCLSA